MANSFFRKIPRLLLYVSAHIGWVWPAFIILRNFIKPVQPIHKSRAFGLLVLSGEKSRGDIEVLAGLESFNVYVLSVDWLFILYRANYGVRKRLIADFFNPKNNEDISASRKKYRHFLSKLVPRLYSYMKIDGVIGFAVHYRQDYDFGAESNLMGFPYVVLHRENMFDNTGHRKYIEYKSRIMGKFSGSLLVTHNETTRSAFINSGFAKPDQVLSLGCLRMDAWLRDLCGSDHLSGIKTVVLFSFPPGVGLLFPEQLDFGENKNWPQNNNGFYELFYSVHGAIAQIATDRPDVNFLIKTKGGSRYMDEIKRSCLLKKLDFDGIKNLTVTHSESAHELIQKASVVVAFGSTALLESGLIGKPTIMPYYEEAKLERWADYLHFAEDLDAFYIAKSEAELKTVILEKIANQHFPEEKRTRCRYLFGKYVSSLSGDAAKRYADAINQCLNNKKITHSGENI